MSPRDGFRGRRLTGATVLATTGWLGLATALLVPAFSPSAAVLLAAGTLLCWLLARCTARRLHERPGRLRRAGEPTLVVGDPDDVVRTVQQLAHHPEAGARPVATAGWQGDVPTPLPHEDGQDLLAAIRRRRIRHVVIASAGWVDAAAELFGPERPTGVRVSIAPRSGVAYRETTVVDLCGVPYLSIGPRTSEVEATCSRTGPSAPVGVEPARYAALVADALEPSADPVDVSIVVVTHESAAHIVSCLDSLARIHDRASREIIVVDNVSTDGTPDLVASADGVRLLRKRRRDGFSVNSNIGVAASSGRYVLLLNPDTVMEDGVVDALVDHLERHPDVGAVAPRLQYPDGRPQPAARRFPSPLTALVRRTPIRQLLPDHADSHLVACSFDGVRDVDWCLGAALLVRTSALHQLRGLDDGYRLYCEDIDLCWRLREAGWAVQQLSSAVVTHALGELTSKRFATRATLWHLRSVLRFGRLHGLRPVRSSPVLAEAASPMAPMIDVGSDDVIIDLRELAKAEQ